VLAALEIPSAGIQIRDRYCSVQEGIASSAGNEAA